MPLSLIMAMISDSLYSGAAGTFISLSSRTSLPSGILGLTWMWYGYIS